jgi:hypothetical protein
MAWRIRGESGEQKMTMGFGGPGLQPPQDRSIKTKTKNKRFGFWVLGFRKLLKV